jgi:hypothetical protein
MALQVMGEDYAVCKREHELRAQPMRSTMSQTVLLSFATFAAAGLCLSV